MRLVDLTTRLYRLPLSHPMSDATHGQMTHFELVTVTLHDNEGRAGLGYSYTIGEGGAALRALLEHAIRPLLIGADSRRVEQLWQRMWWQLHYIGRGGLVSFAMSAVDIALWDLRGVREGEPLWRLLGGYSGSARAYAGGIDLQLSLEELLAQTQANLDAGFRAIKIKVGRERLREDVERVLEVRALIGPDIPLMVDANMRWTVETAIRAARAFREHDVYWLEEPTIPEDFRGHGRIAREGGLPLAAGENFRSIYEFQHLLAEQAVDFPEPDVSNIGGITPWMRVAQMAHAHNLPVTSHGVHELHLHLLAAIPNPSLMEVHSFGLERFMFDPPRLQEGIMYAGEAPGHGVRLNMDALAEFEQDRG